MKRGGTRSVVVLVGLLGVGCGGNGKSKLDAGPDMAPPSDAVASDRPPETGAEAGADGAGPDLVPGIEPLTPVRTTSFRRITSYPRGMGAKFISDARISANGSRVIFSAVDGTYTIAADGSNQVQLSDQRNDGRIDISADGSKVVWYDGARDGWSAGSDGSGKVKLAGTHAVNALRLTAAGDQVYEIAPEAGGLIKLPASGGALTLLKATMDVATLNTVDANPNHWRGVLDISDDGSKVVFSWLWDAFSMMGDGSGLKQLTQFLMPENRTLKSVAISGNGAKLAWNTEDGVRSTVTISDWGGGNKLEYVGFLYSSGTWLRLSGDGSKAALGWGIRLLDTGKLDPYDATDSGSNSVPLGRPAGVTLTRDGKRACLFVEGPESTDQGRPNQVVIVDFDPASPSGPPSISGTATTLRLVPNDGSKQSTLFARVQGADVTEVHAMGLRGGFRLSGLITPWMQWPLGDLGANGDATAMDGTWSITPVRFTTDAMVTPGPVGIRFTAANKAGHVLMVDTAGMESRAP